jgi:hypothetical protein
MNGGRYRVHVTCTHVVAVPAMSLEQAEDFALIEARAQFPGLDWLVSHTEEEI